jgi:PAS domain S-box-containing protein
MSFRPLMHAARPSHAPLRKPDSSPWQRFMSRLPRRSTQGERAMTVLSAGALFVAVFALGILFDNPREAVSILYTLPVALVAIRFGTAGGLAAAACALGLVALMNVITDKEIGVLGYVTRGVAFGLLGAVLGNFSNRLRSAYEMASGRGRQLQAILDNSPAVIYLKDREGRYMLVNRQFEELFHVDRDTLVGKTAHDVFPHYLADAFIANDRRVLKERTALEMEEDAPHDDGTNHTYISVKFPLFDANGNVYGVCGIATDITERKATESALKEGRDRIGQIIDTAREAFLSMDQDGKVTAWNRAAEDMFGYRSSQAIGRRLAELIIPERYRDAHTRGIERFLRTGKGPMLNKRVELLALHRDGTEFPVEVGITAVRVRGGFAFHAFIHDISDRKRLEREVVRLSELRAGVE